MNKYILFVAAFWTSAICSAQTVYTLEQILDSARHNNISIRNAQRSIDAAQHQRKEAFTKYFPSVSGTAAWFNANRDMAKMDMMGMSISMMKNGTIAGINATQPVFAGGQIINGNRLAKIGEDVAMLQMQLSENEVEKTAEQYYWQIVSLEEKLKTIAAVKALLNDIHKDVSVDVDRKSVV